MKRQLALFLSISFLMTIFCTSCTKKEDDALDLTVYINELVSVKIYEGQTETTQKLNTFLDSEHTLSQRYKYITFKANKKWTYGLTLKKLTFDIISNESVELDFTLTISHLKNAENYNSTYDFFYFSKNFYASCTKNNPQQINIEINDEFINKDAEISFSLDSAYLERSKDFKYSLTNLKLFGEHIQENY